jgi:hypothetical protein
VRKYVHNDLSKIRIVIFLNLNLKLQVFMIFILFYTNNN